MTLAAQGAAWDPAGPAASTFDQVKIKVGLAPSDVHRVIQIHRTASLPERIDANQAWDLATATAAVEAWLAAGVRLDFPRAATTGMGPRRARGTAEAGAGSDRAGRVGVHDPRPSARDRSRQRRHRQHQAGQVRGLHAGLELASLARDAGLGLMVGSMMESELGLSAAAALASTLAPDQVHDLDAAWWSIDPVSDPGTPYRDGRFVIDDSPGLSHAVARVGATGLTWEARSGR